MVQSQLISVNLTDNEKKRKNENTHKELSKKIACIYQGFIRNRGMFILRGGPIK